MRIIRNRHISDSRWQHVPEGASVLDTTTSLPNAVVVTLADWRLHKQALLGRGVSVGVRLAAADAVDEIADDLNDIGLVALEFETFTEGRPYTQARLLRERYGYRGEIRAVGDVSRDRLAFMERCGFDAYELGEDGDLGDAITAFAEISDVYQPAADRRPVIADRRS